MALGISGGQSTPHIKYDARAGRVTRVDGPEALVDLTNVFRAVFDLEQIEVGWVFFQSKTAPDFAMGRIGAIPPQPSNYHKRGFRLNLLLAQDNGGDVREFASAATCVIDAIDQLHNDYMAAPESKQGKLPIVALTGTAPVHSTIKATGQRSTNYKPTFVIQGWVDRPELLPIVAAPPARQPATAQAPQAPAGGFGQPTPAAAPQPPGGNFGVQPLPHGYGQPTPGGFGNPAQAPQAPGYGQSAPQAPAGGFGQPAPGYRTEF